MVLNQRSMVSGSVSAWKTALAMAAALEAGLTGYTYLSDDAKG